MYPIDTKRLALSDNKNFKNIKNLKPPRHKRGEKFLKGPIPWVWLVEAAKLSGKALNLAIVIWFLAGIKRRRKIVLSSAVVRTLCVNRYAKNRALKKLETAGLISVERHKGRNPTVIILDIRENE
jgi:hypothetical protein